MSHFARKSGAFTLVEMLVVVAIIVLLISLLLPSLRTARDSATRSKCASNMSGIGQAAVEYGTANSGRLFIARGRSVQKCFNPGGLSVHNDRSWDASIDWVDALATVGLAVGPKKNQGGGITHYDASPLWDCPGRAYKSQWEVGYPQLVVGYQYLGGIDTWLNPYVGSMKSRSPVSLRSNGRWTLAADAAMKIDGVWGGGRASAYGGLPAHKAGGQVYPAGGNQLYLDGSVQWVDFSKLIFIHSWNPAARIGYFYQDDLGAWTPPPAAYGKP